jgi:hypothetical protein
VTTPDVHRIAMDIARLFADHPEDARKILGVIVGQFESHAATAIARAEAAEAERDRLADVRERLVLLLGDLSRATPYRFIDAELCSRLKAVGIEVES